MKKQLLLLSSMFLLFLYTGCEKDDTVEYTITLTNDENGIASSNVTKAVRGTTVTLTATPNSDYIFSKWMVESGDITLSTPSISPATFTMPASNVEIRAIFGKADILPLITDPAFKAYAEYRMDNTGNEGDEIVHPVWDTNSDGKLSETEAAAVTFINLIEGFNGISVKSMEGIEYFSGLLKLICENNELTSLDVSNNTALIGLDCYNNEITSLDLSKNTALEILRFGKNPITSIDLSKNVALTMLSCMNSKLTSLDVSENTELYLLECNNSQLSSLDVSKNKELVHLHCSNNRLTTLITGKIAKLFRLNCENNQLIDLDVSGNSALADLVCFNNQLTSLNIGGNPALGSLNCHTNKLAYLDISGCTNLEFLNCYYNANPFKIKVWDSFNIEDPDSNSVVLSWDANIQFVYQF